MHYKHPVSVLVVIYAVDTGRVLMLQRQDDASFWQSVTGSLEEGEMPFQAAVREIREETGIDIEQENLTLTDLEHQVSYEIFPQYRYRYAPGTRFNQEHWFALAIPHEISVHLTEHLAQQWLPWQAAAALTKSWNNRDAINSLFEAEII